LIASLDVGAEMNDPREAPLPRLAVAVHLPGKPLVITISEHIGALVVPPSPR
jgi:hypothetical protein